MRFYRGYTFKDVMGEKAHIFFALLNESYRQEAVERIQEIMITSSPNMKKQDRSQLLKNYERMSKDKYDYMEQGDNSNIQKLKGKL